ncbi:MAG TPA: hypothetical protein VHB21_02665, partial [Minicystis sp.]|nr:hypothetical protein [Minicystis sp.]
MADTDREDDEAKRREEEEEEDAALTGKDRDEAAAEAEAEEQAAREPAEPEAASAAPGGATAKRPLAQRKLAERRSPPKGSLTKSLMLFVIIVGGLIVAFALIGREEPNANGPVPAPKWSTGQTVDLELTVVPSDAKDLACSSVEEIDGQKCEFSAPGKLQAPALTDEKKTFKPYTTTDRIQVIGAGLWSQPALAPNKLPNTRFSVKCKYKIEGKL